MTACHKRVVGLGRKLFLALIFGAALCNQGACSPIPSKFIKQAEPGATLTALVNQPAAYAGKVVILGGVIIQERQAEGRTWLHVRNRSSARSTSAGGAMGSRTPPGRPSRIRITSFRLPFARNLASSRGLGP